MRIYEIQKTHSELIHRIEENHGEISEQDEALLELINDAVQNKSNDLFAILKNWEIETNCIDVEIKRLNALKIARNKAASNLKNKLLSVMQSLNIDKIRGTTCQVSIAKNPPSLEVFDESLVPTEYIKVTQTFSIDKKAILTKMKKGELIEGCAIINDKKNIRIKDLTLDASI